MSESFIPSACIIHDGGWIEIEGDWCYRYIKRPQLEEVLFSEFYEQGARKGFFPRFEESNRLAKNKQDNYIICIKTRRIRQVSRFSEWSPMQLRDAIIFMYKVILFCRQWNISLYPPHLGNIVFVDGKPQYIDIGDFYKDSPETPPMEVSHYLYTFLANEPIKENPIRIDRYFTNWKHLMEKAKKVEKYEVQKVYSEEFIYEYLSRLFQETEFTNRQSDWVDYTKCIPEKDDIEGFRNHSQEKSSVIFDTLRRYQPKTVLDIGCNTGIHSFLAEAVTDAEITGIDIDALSVEKAYKTAQERQSRCNFLWFDIMNPPLVTGLNGAFELSSTRLRSEFVICAALIHHLFRQGKELRDIIEKLTSYSEKYLLLEYIALDEFTPSIDEVCDCLSSFGFVIVDIKSSYPEPRKWIVAKRNEAL